MDGFDRSLTIRRLEKMKSVLILQNEIMEYRKPVYNALAEHYDVTVLHSGKKSINNEDRYKEITTPSMRVWRFFIQPRSPLPRLIDDFDVVIAMFDLAWPAYIIPVYTRRSGGKKFIFWGHRYSKNTFSCRLRDHLMSKADRLLMYGDEEIGRMIDRGVDPNKIAIAWNTMHVPNSRDYSKMQKNSFIFVGRLQPMKRVDALIKAFASIQRHIPSGTVLHIVGSAASNAPGIEKELRELVTALDITPKIVFHGRVDDPEILAEIFSCAYAYVSPGFVGLGVLHSFAYGVPVITIRDVRHSPEFHNLKQGENAIICEDMSEIERAMVALCSNRTYAALLGQNAYEHYARARTLPRMIEGFRKAIEE